LYHFSIDEDQFKFMKRDKENYLRLPGDPVSLMYCIRATKHTV
jgi:hypothetical protein